MVHVDVEVPEEVVSEVFSEISAAYRKQAVLPGFRKGKAPMSVVRKRFWNDIRNGVRDEILKTIFQKIVAEEPKDILIPPQFKDLNELEVREGESFVCALDYELAPEVELPDYWNLPVKLPEGGVTEEDVDQTVSHWLQEEGATFEDVDRPVQPGDQVKISLEGRLLDPLPEGVELTKAAQAVLHSDGNWIGVHSRTYLADLPEKLVGMSVGEERVVTVEFPEDYIVSLLRGKRVEFTVKLLQVQEKRVPELTEEYAQKLGAASVKQFRDVFRFQLENEDMRKRRAALEAAIQQALLAQPDFPLPRGVLNAEIYVRLRRQLTQLMRDKHSKEEIESRQEELRKSAEHEAKQSLKLHFILSAIAKKEGIKVSNALLDSVLEVMAQREKMPVKKFRERLEKAGRLGDVAAELLRTLTMERLVQFYSDKSREDEKAAEAKPSGPEEDKEEGEGKENAGAAGGGAES